ncbi:carbamoyltransferase HypF [Corynebacterium vitaeruminis]|uniref:carbamoyltransferase HypF n=1 Tax=Corynebacterium vitaeruminis TaxID=38305 RepID=UPI0023F23C94|nr:carbamoyltransferase HypF [Corynebacterium vitaeruminis]
MSITDLQRLAITLTGVVQGVGMRPHIAKVAANHEVTGWCGNNDIEVFIEAQGTPGVLEEFLRDVLSSLPPLARVVSVDKQEKPVRGETGFTIVASTHLPGARTLIPPDVAPCEDCIAEFNDPTNRRYHYPFITCTHCGPRLTIIEELPYDRPNTTLKVFPLCPDCEREYTDVNDRRYHAQPISCPNCGPKVWFEEGERVVAGQDAFSAARELLREGKVLAVRGIGGFHLMCQATDPAAIARLRGLKRRPHKPFAVMVPSLDHARAVVALTPAQEALLTSPARPIVIAPSRGVLPQSIAPGLGDVGVVLPYSPLHMLLVDSPVVATSGNPSGEPLVASIAEARELLGGFCDGFLFHDRDIFVPVEDSVYLGEVPVRRSRGLAPLPLAIPDGPDVFAVGGELKNTMCLTSGGLAHLTSHIGDMGSLRAQEVAERTFAQMSSLRGVEPSAIVCDMHPGYSTTAWAERLSDRLGLPLLQVQHHQAHAASVLAEHGLLGRPAVVIAADGTGYGLDGTIWGGEIFVVSPELVFERAWHVPSFPLAGGDRAVTYPWRIVLGVSASWGVSGPLVSRLRSSVDAGELRLVSSQLGSGIGTVATSSLGRLFDAAACLVGCGTFGTAVSYEAQAAMEFEHLARGGACSWDGVSTLAEAFAVLASSSGGANAARQFHRHVAQVLGARAAEVAGTSGAQVVAMTGGCAFNRLLLADLREFLRGRGYELVVHEQVPPGDGGLSLGQAVLGRAMLARGEG